MGEGRRRSFTFCPTCEKPPKPACLEAGHVLVVGTLPTGGVGTTSAGARAISADARLQALMPRTLYGPV
jgi:hypothetical protein